MRIPPGISATMYPVYSATIRNPTAVVVRSNSAFTYGVTTMIARKPKLPIIWIVSMMPTGASVVSCGVRTTALRRRHSPVTGLHSFFLSTR